MRINTIARMTISAAALILVIGAMACGRGTDAIVSYVEAIYPETMTIERRVIASRPTNLFEHMWAKVFQVPAAFAVSDVKIPPLAVVPQNTWYVRQDPECSTIDIVTDLQIMPSGDLNNGEYTLLLETGKKYVFVGVAASGVQNAAKSGCNTTNIMAHEFDWAFDGSCAFATVEDGANDGEALVTAVTDSGATKCQLYVTAKDAEKTVRSAYNIAIAVTATASAPTIDAIKVDGEVVDYNQPVPVNFSQSYIELEVVSPDSRASTTQWNMSSGMNGAIGSNAISWKAPSPGMGEALVLVSVKDDVTGVLKQVKFLAVE